MHADAAHDAIIACAERHQVVVAPPGTGKTHVSVRLAGELSGQLPAHARVLLLTFSRQARSQLETEARRQLTSEQRARIEITNYHRFCSQIVQAHRRALGLPEALDVGSSRRRADALKRASVDGWQHVKSHPGLCDSLGEHRFAALRDQRTPGPELLTPLLAAVHDEQRAGRLVFDDFGALWWELLESQPSIARALGLRYPIVIADEHQDASGLQDALVRRLGTQRLVVLADHMQLIHGFRGADIERLRAHWRDSGATHELKTPHRWRGRDAEGSWLLACRDRLQGRQTNGARPSGARVVNFDGAHGIGGALFKMKTVVPKLFDAGHRTVAILVADNQDLARVRNYLANNGMHPRQLGGSKDFEEARDDIEQLPLLTDSHSVVLHAYERLLALVPSVPKPVAEQIKRRLKPGGPNLTGAKDAAARLLNAFGPIYAHGAAGYFQAMDAALIACRDLGYHLPRRDAARTIQETAAALAPDCELEQAVATYSKRMAESGYRAAETYRHGLLVMTMHQSKGKEFDAVVIGPLDQRRWPDSDAHRRLLYVGLTRATASWTLIVPSSGVSPLLALLPLSQPDPGARNRQRRRLRYSREDPGTEVPT